MPTLKELQKTVQRLQSELKEVRKEIDAALKEEAEFDPMYEAIKEFIDKAYRLDGLSVISSKKLFNNFIQCIGRKQAHKVTFHVFESKVKEIVGRDNWGMFTPLDAYICFKLKRIV